MADKVNPFEVYQKDPRIACQYGAKCYQKNPVHHQRYKHPPAPAQKLTGRKAPTKGQKRKTNTKNGPRTSIPKAKVKKDDALVFPDHRMSPTPSLSSASDVDEETDRSSPKDSEKYSSSSEDNQSPKKDTRTSTVLQSPEKTTSSSSDKVKKQETKEIDNEISKSPSVRSTNKAISEPSNSAKSNETKGNADSVPEAKKKLIEDLFLLKMPPDFYQFYEFCCSLSATAPASGLKIIGLELVGPFDVLCGKIEKLPEDKEKYLTHWRYYYDPPEFQTVLKGNERDGLHFGYWRDEDDELPVFVAKNLANRDNKIVPVAENLFGAALVYTEQQLKTASPFEKANVSRLLQKIKLYAKNNNISLEENSLNMRSRDRKTVTKTFHGAGIVVPYNKRTQVGYRTLAATDSQLKIILKRLEEGDEETKRQQLSSIEEIVRLATIAADECDFGTPLELAHDLFSSGVAAVQGKALQMFTMSYNLLRRPIFSKIAEAHLRERKKDKNLSVL